MEDVLPTSRSDQDRASVQDAVKRACSITDISERLGYSRPSIYKYMGMFDSGNTGKIPEDVLGFLSFVAPGRTKDEVEQYFEYLRVNPPEEQDSRVVDNIDVIIGREAEPSIPLAEEEPCGAFDVKILSDSFKVMVAFPALDSDNVAVRLFADFDGVITQIAEYRPAPGTRFVTIEGLVSGVTFYCEVLDPSTGESSGQVPFEI